MLLFNKLKKLNSSSGYQHLLDRLEQYSLLIRLDRPIGVYLLLWPTLWALWIAAKGMPDALVLFVFMTGVFLMRSAGCAINDFADRDIDPHVERTKDRPLAAGRVTSKETLAVFATLSITAFALVLLMNPLTIYMSFVGIALAASYPFAKRFHYMPQVHLGIAFGWAAPMAFTAQANEITAITWLIFMATILWATAYDTMYAMADREDDLQIGVKSTAILFGDADKLIVGLLQVLLIFDLVLIGSSSNLGLYYYIGLAAASGLAIYQQYLIKDRDRQKCIQAFVNNNWFGLCIFMGLFVDYYKA
ncbi:MAG: 4-hydroxybenzoate octaprenyltransferase [endosymbiont of Galathealinum brachiosum]|uniref:4-hydroxybenzoate octaprenyltransferase n=1 Tax=endosymbiont of Galathealinum brachiosum TaxID=2200906 RepID=A0A370DDX6_9GAMM|nr:MAG: 4-hydroxybenzoate octaprenyltransferase [endosymbiont of Galathealinum brachiosum]